MYSMTTVLFVFFLQHLLLFLLIALRLRLFVQQRCPSFLPAPELPGTALAAGVCLRNPLVHPSRPPPSNQLLPALLGFGALGRSDALFNPHHLFCLEIKKEGKKLMFWVNTWNCFEPLELSCGSQLITFLYKEIQEVKGHGEVIHYREADRRTVSLGLSEKFFALLALDMEPITTEPKLAWNDHEEQVCCRHCWNYWK